MWSPSIRPETQVRVTNNPDHQETAAKCCSFGPEAGTAQRSGDSRNASALRPARRGSAVDANAAGIAGAGARSNARCAQRGESRPICRAIGTTRCRMFIGFIFFEPARSVEPGNRSSLEASTSTCDGSRGIVHLTSPARVNVAS